MSAGLRPARRRLDGLAVLDDDDDGAADVIEGRRPGLVRHVADVGDTRRGHR